jgi:hypothetical protein
VQSMNGVDRKDLDEAITTAFHELSTAMNSHSEQGVEVYSRALRALVPLRQQLIDDHVRSLPKR